MGLFSAIVGVAIETVLIPVAVAKDVLTLGNAGFGRPFTVKQIEKIKEEAEKADQ